MQRYPPNWMFRTPVADLIAPPTGTFGADVTIGEIARALRTRREPAAVCSSEGTLIALVRNADVIDWLLRGASPSDRLPPIGAMRQDRIAAGNTCFEALARMLGEDIRELAVTGPNGRHAGIISRERILAAAAGYIFDVAEAGALRMSGTAADTRITGSQQMREAQLAIAREMLAGAIPAEAILATLTEINNEVHRRVVADARSALEADGWGPPPAAFALAVMGSSGRGENLLDPDQDNALIIADTDEAGRQSAATYFIALSERITAGLAAAGFTYCKGNMMATSPVWRKTESEWRAQIRSWVRRREPVLLMNCDTLLDMAPVAGDEPLATRLRTDLIDMVRREPGFLRALYSIEEDHGVALDWLGRLAREKDDFGEVAETNVKLRGTLPLLEGARLLSVKAGIDETATVARLRALAAAGVLDGETADGLVEAYRTLVVRLLNHQIAARQTSVSSSIRISHQSMSRAEKAVLRDALRRIARFRSSLPALLEGGSSHSPHAA